APPRNSVRSEWLTETLQSPHPHPRHPTTSCPNLSKTLPSADYCLTRKSWLPPSLPRLPLGHRLTGAAPQPTSYAPRQNPAAIGSPPATTPRPRAVFPAA